MSDDQCPVCDDTWLKIAMGDDKSPACDSSDWMPSLDEVLVDSPFPCSQCGYPLVLNEYRDEDGLEIHLEMASHEEDPRVLAWTRDAVRVRRERDMAVSLLRMLDRADARHPDVAAFLDGLDVPDDALRDGEVEP